MNTIYVFVFVFLYCVMHCILVKVYNCFTGKHTLGWAWHLDHRTYEICCCLTLGMQTAILNSDDKTSVACLYYECLCWTNLLIAALDLIQCKTLLQNRWVYTCMKNISYACFSRVKVWYRLKLNFKIGFFIDLLGFFSHRFVLNFLQRFLVAGIKFDKNIFKSEWF